MRYVTLIKLSDEGKKRFPESDKLFAKVLETVEFYGGKNLETYALGGRYDFFAVTDYPTPEIAFEARIKLLELGIFDTLDAYEAFDMELFLAKV